MNKTKKKLCYNCSGTTSKTRSKVKKQIADWKQEMGLKTHYPADKIMECKTKYPAKFNTSYKLNVGEKHQGRYVYYYCATQKNSNDCLTPLHASKAYGKDFPNKGVAKINKNGEAIVKFECPQSYYVNNNDKLHVPHLHYFISNNNNSGWNPTLYTQRIICHLDKKQLQQLIKTQCAVIINALPYAEYIKNRIPNSVPLPYTIATQHQVSKKQLIDYIQDMLVHYPKIHNKVKQGKLDILNVPIVVYCYKSTCNASMLLIEELIEMGFKDIREYPGGIVDWIKK